MDGRCAGFIEQRRENFRRSASTQVKPAAVLGKLAAKRGKAPVQPPARGAAHAQSSRRLVVENVDGEEGRADLRRLAECGMIGKPEFEPKPDDGGLLGQSRDRPQSPRMAASAAS
jgi:hypothetical protein